MKLEDLKAFEIEVKKLIPGFRLAWKDELWHQKVVGFLARPFNPKYTTGFTSTFYPAVYFPSKAKYEANPSGSFATLAHELVHLLDAQRFPLGFTCLYGFPQLLALPLIVTAVTLAFFVGWWSVPAFLLAASSLAPWPSPWRVHFEKRGYAMSMAVVYWVTGDIPHERLDRIRQHFTGMAYYGMSWSPRDIDAWVAETQRRIVSGTIKDEMAFGLVHTFLHERGLAQK